MKLITKVQTLDGALHDSPESALRHLDRLFGEAITRLSHQMIRETEGKYTRIQNFIKDNLDAFKALMDIKQDMDLKDSSDD